MARQRSLLCLLCLLICNSLTLGSQFLIAESKYAFLRAPRAAYSPISKSYLVAWEHDLTAYNFRDIHCQLVDHEGQLLADPIELQAPREGVEAIWHNPDVACNTQQDEFLVVYAYVEESPLVVFEGIRGRFIGSEGTLGALIQIDPHGHRPGASPAVTYDPWANQYLVVWVRNQDEIWAQAVHADGTLKGLPLRVDPGVQDCNCPSVACGHGQYLVVWQQDDASKSAIKAHRVTIGSNGATLVGTMIECKEADESQTRPRVAHCSVANEYLVVWEVVPSDVNDLPEIVCQQIAPNGATHDASVVASGGPLQCTRPDVASAAASGGYFVTWEHFETGRGGIAVQYVSSDGRVWGSPQWVGKPFVPVCQSPALNLGADGNGLIVWEDSVIGASGPFPPDPPEPDLSVTQRICGSVDPEWMAIPPIARIDLPTFLEPICGVYEVMGEACVTEGLDSYKVEYRDALGPEDQWTIIAQSSFPVCGSDRLATWDTNGMVPGPYYLRLTVTSTDGLETTDFVAVYIDEDCDN